MTSEQDAFQSYGQSCDEQSLAANAAPEIMGKDCEVKSPCIDVCKLGPNQICTGCFRSIHEIAIWSSCTETARREIIARLSQRRLSPSA